MICVLLSVTVVRPCCEMVYSSNVCYCMHTCFYLQPMFNCMRIMHQANGPFFNVTGGTPPTIFLKTMIRLIRILRLVAKAQWSHRNMNWQRIRSASLNDIPFRSFARDLKPTLHFQIEPPSAYLRKTSLLAPTWQGHNENVHESMPSTK